MNSIDHNPDPRYLKAVKSISIKYLDCDNVEYVRDNINKLFHRFPNLEKVYTRNCLDLFENFDTKALLKNCPKLKKFEIDTYQKSDFRYCQLLIQLRDLVTVININDINYAESGFASFLDFITSFPRLIKIRGCTYQLLGTFEKLLPVLSRLSHLESISIGTDEAFIDNAELYLSQKTQEEQDVLLARLSNLKKVKFYSDTGFSIDSLKFASKYLTGLTTFRFDVTPLNESHFEAFCENVLDLFCSTRHDANIYAKNVPIDAISQYFSTIANKLAQTKLILKLVAQDSSMLVSKPYIKDDAIDISITKRQHECVLEVTVSNLLQQIASAFFCQNIYVHMFKLEILYRGDYDLAVNNLVYDSFLQKMPVVKDVSLDIPRSYSDNSKDFIEVTYTQVQSVTLRAAPSGNMQLLLDRYCMAFPNLTCMKLHYNCGTWDDKTGVYKVDLARYTLERLVMDVTPLKFKMKKMFKQFTIKNNFFVISMICNGRKQLFKVPFDLSSSRKLTDTDLLNDQHYFTVDITVNSLCKLDLLLQIDSDEEEDNHNKEDTTEDIDEDYYDIYYDSYLNFTFSSRIACTTLLI